jgi:hypothetical protein
VAWLGRQNAAWAWAADDPSGTHGGDGDGDGEGDGEGDGRGDVWRTGTSAARMAWLGERRAVDPGDARRHVEGSWKGESAKDRALIVAALRTGLGPDDEAFLEAALDDRAAAVRAAAADLLASLPGSALAGRMAERVRALVSGPPWRVALPESIDAAARRDGVVDTGAPAATGKRTWWLIQMVGAAPLSIWPRASDAVAEAPPDLVRGWVRAAGRQGDADWSRALLRLAPDPALLAALPPGAARDLLPVGLETAPDPALAGLLAATPGPWPELLSRWVVQRLRAATQAAAVDRALVGLAGAADVGIIPDLERWIDDLKKHDHLRVALAHVTHALSIRHAIAQELS